MAWLKKYGSNVSRARAASGMQNSEIKKLILNFLICSQYSFIVNLFVSKRILLFEFNCLCARRYKNRGPAGHNNDDYALFFVFMQDVNV